MRYSKAKMILTTIVSIISVFAIVFLVVKGINYSKNLTETEIDTKKVVASVSNRKVEEAKKKEESKKTTKKETKKETKKKEEVQDDAEPVEYTYLSAEERVEYDTSFNGKYVVKELKIGDKEYSAQEIRDLIADGTPMSLIINKYGIADVAVMDLKKMYEVTEDYFDDGVNQIKYAKNVGRIRITIDDKEILFVKE